MSRARVHGAGPTGCLAALALVQAGWQVSLHDPLDGPVLLRRQRAYALTHSSADLLERLGLWPHISPHLVPFSSLELWDQGTGRQCHLVPPTWPLATAGAGQPGLPLNPLPRRTPRHIDPNGKAKLSAGSSNTVP